MKKFTRRSYNRKLIVFGVSIFVAVSLISIGFASWVMSAVTTYKANEGYKQVQVATVTDASMSITVDQDQGDAWDATQILSFDAVATDYEGRVQASKDSAGEHLTMKISGKVTHPEMLKTLEMTITLPDSLANAVKEGYLKVVKVNDDGEPTANEVTLADGNKIVLGGANADKHAELKWKADANAEFGTFEYTLAFAWGEYFGGENPSVFYDSNEAYRTTDGTSVAGAAIEADVMKAEMQKFRAILTDNWDYDNGKVKAGYDEKNQTPYEGHIAIIIKAAA